MGKRREQTERAEAIQKLKAITYELEAMPFFGLTDDEVEKIEVAIAALQDVTGEENE